MKILKFKLLKDFARKHPDAADPLMRWAEFVEKTEWKSHAELKQAFPSADYVGNDRYVFNISGNKFRLVKLSLCSFKDFYILDLLELMLNMTRLRILKIYNYDY